MKEDFVFMKEELYFDFVQMNNFFLDLIKSLPEEN